MPRQWRVLAQCSPSQYAWALVCGSTEYQPGAMLTAGDDDGGAVGAGGGGDSAVGSSLIEDSTGRTSTRHAVDGNDRDDGT